MSHEGVLLLSESSGTPIPENMEILKWSDHARKAGKIGGEIHYAKYGRVGDESKRKEKWKEWWDGEGKYKNQNILQRKSITTPEKNLLLAEFVGIMMGDGNINDYSIRVTLDSVADDKYILFVIALMEQLFGVIPKLYQDKNSRAVDLVIARKNLVEFCLSIGLKKGDKLRQGLDIPDWVKENKSFSLVCIRGLVDTDGCFFNHVYKVNGKEYNYAKIAFTSKSPQLLNSVSEILIKLGIYVRMTKDGNDLRLESQKDVIKYIELIGTSNPKFDERVKFGNVAEPGRLRIFAKDVGPLKVSRVRIPPFPQ